MLHSDKEETACFNLVSVCLGSFVVYDDDKEELYFSFEVLKEATRMLVRALHWVIDKTQYPIESALVSNVKHRPIGIGV